jgi:hypothetical protein
MFQVYVPNVSSVLDVCYKCFHLDVTKVDLDCAYTCMLHAYVSSVSYVCCKCFIWMSHMFAMIFKSGVLQVFHTHVLSISSVFSCMLQLLHLNVSKVDQVLHMGCAW